MRAATAEALRPTTDRDATAQEQGAPVDRIAVSTVPEAVAWTIIAGAALMRLSGLLEWSLWEDEETTIYFALNPERSFARAFPVFFHGLGGLFQLTGVSVAAGRLLVAAIGTLSLVVAYRCTRRVCGQPVALVALVLMALSPGHLFWSQSIRYYGLALVFQLVSIWCFLEGLARTRRRWLILSAAAFLLALATHHSAALIAPVYGVFLLSLLIRRRIARRYWIGAAAFAVMLAAIVGLRYDGFAGVRNILEGGAVRPQQFPFALLAAGTAYFGVPAVALAAFGLVRARSWSHEYFFFALLATVPPLELVLIRYQGLIFYVLWYYGLVALFGVAVLAGRALIDLWRTAPRWLTGGIVAVSLTVYAVQLGAYYTVAHGDRPRWKEAAAHVSVHMGDVQSSPAMVYAGVPGVVAHYLGVPPDETMGHPRVQVPPPVALRPAVESWYIVEARLVEAGERAWYAAHCLQSGRLESRMLVRDRTLLILHCGVQP